MTQNIKVRAAFLRDIAWSNAWGASVQRGKVYASGSSEQERVQVQRAVRSEVELLETAYVGEVDEDRHCVNITAVADRVSAQVGYGLTDGRYRIGTAQKVLNMYLKFLWCFGLAAKPPHLPLDRTIQSIAGIKEPVLWTKLDDIEEYRKALRSIETSGMKLADWELAAWRSESSRLP